MSYSKFIFFFLIICLHIARLEQDASSAMACAGAVGYFESHIIGRTIHIERYGHIIETFADVGYLKSLNEAAFVALERELVHQQFHISHAVDVVIDVEVAIFEAMRLGMLISHRQ